MRLFIEVEHDEMPNTLEQMDRLLKCIGHGKAFVHGCALNPDHLKKVGVTYPDIKFPASEEKS